MKALITSCLLIAAPLVASADDAKKPAAGAPAAPAVVAPVPPPMPKPAPELDALKGYLKTWSCSGTAGPMNDKATAKLTMKKDLSDFWISVRFETAKSAKMPSFVGVGYIGIDQIAKGWTFDGWDNFGGRIMLKAAMAGVTADAMTFTGDAIDMGKKESANFHFTMDGKTKHVHFSAEFDGKKGFDYDCK